MGNLRSVQKALVHVAPSRGGDHRRAGCHPGGGPGRVSGARAMPDCMKCLAESGLGRRCAKRPLEAVPRPVHRPADALREKRRGRHPGLAILPGEILAFRPRPGNARCRLKIPHMAGTRPGRRGPRLWRELRRRPLLLRAQLLLRPRRPALTAAISRYPHAFTSAIARDNIFATQFHPEKSSVAGLTLLENFASWNPVRIRPRPFPC